MMKILLANNFYYNRGGDCTYVFALKQLLEKKGHEVGVFSMSHPQNFNSNYENYFVSYIDYTEEIKKKNIYSGIKVLSRSIFSFEAKQKIDALIRQERPDVVHLNNIRHHLTPSILYAIKKYNIPVVWTLHDYQLICPNISFLSGGRICEKCKTRKYFWPALVKCKKGSFLASAMAAFEHSVQMMLNVYNLVDVFICPSKFLKEKFMEYGFYEDRLVLLNYFVDMEDRSLDNIPGDYLIYVGRLSEEKGVKTLIDAVMKINPCKLKIVGDGPLRKKLISYVKEKGGHLTIKFLGHKKHEEVVELIRGSKFVVVPSEWYENYPYTVLETFACGKPVIGSRMGGIPELVRDYETGLTFESRNVDELKSKIEYLIGHPEAGVKMGKAGRTYVTEALNGEKHYQKLLNIYKQAAENKRQKK